MATESQPVPGHPPPPGEHSVEMPRPTVAPLVLSVGMAMLAAGAIMGSAFLVVGILILAFGLGAWVLDLRPGRGHVHEELAPPEQRPKPVTPSRERVPQLRPGLPGYRIRLPEEVHPVSAGIKGGIVGGLVMPLPALAYGLLSGYGPWYPINLLAGMVLPIVGTMAVADLEHFHLSLFIVGLIIHAVTAVFFGLMYGILLPTMPPIPTPISWGGLLIPLLWTGITFNVMGRINPVLQNHVDWPWFVASQFIFGVVAAAVFMGARKKLPDVVAGIVGGAVGAVVMPLPAVLWSLASRHGIWYPANLLAGVVQPGMGELPTSELQGFHPEWLWVAVGMHLVMSLGIGVVNGLLLPRLRHIPAPLAWGGLLVPLLWTAVSFNLMGAVNPVLQERVDWPWFIVSQFVFGVVAAAVVLRSQVIHIPAAGSGPDRVAEYVTGQSGILRRGGNP